MVIQGKTPQKTGISPKHTNNTRFIGFRSKNTAVGPLLCSPSQEEEAGLVDYEESLRERARLEPTLPNTDATRCQEFSEEFQEGLLSKYSGSSAREHRELHGGRVYDENVWAEARVVPVPSPGSRSRYQNQRHETAHSQNSVPGKHTMARAGTMPFYRNSR